MSWIIFLLLIQSGTHAVDYVNGPLSLSGTPNDEESVNEGDSVALQCKLDAHPTPSFSIWTSDGNQLYEMDPGEDTVQLTLQRNYSRIGIYCRADGNLTEYPIISSALMYTIQFPVSNITMTQSPPGAVPDGTEVTFTCVTDESEPLANVRWRVGPTSGLLGSVSVENGMYNAVKTISQYGPLEVDKIRNDQEVECYITDDPAMKDTIILNVTFSATAITMVPVPNGQVPTNTEVTFTCTTDDANPVPEIVWTRNGNTLTSSDVSSTQDGQKRVSILTLTSAKELNENVFGCTVEGTIITAAHALFVSFSPTTIALTPSHLGRIAEDIDITLTCLTDEANPTAEIVWSRDGNIVNTGISESEVSGQYNVKKRESVLTVKTDRSLNGVKYTCHVGGKQEIADSVVLQVKFPATDLTLDVSPTSPVSDNTVMTFTCTSDEANPVALVVLTKNGADIGGIPVSTESGQYNAERSISTLTVTAVRTLNDARYGCRVPGTGLSQQHILDVRFPHDVEVTSDPANDLLSGSSLTLTCDATGGNPAEVLSYSWSFVPRYGGSSELSGDTDRQLQFDSVVFSNAGIYSCEVDNGAGLNSDSEQLLVQFPPQDVSTSEQKSVYSSVNSDVLLSCQARAYPRVFPTSVTIRFQESFLSSDDFTVSNSPARNLPVDQIMIELAFTSLKESDFGTYEVTLNNGIGTPTVITMTLAQDTVGDTEEGSNPSGPPIGLIVGVAVAALVLIGGLVAFVVLFYRRKKTKPRKKPPSRDSVKRMNECEVDGTINTGHTNEGFGSSSDKLDSFPLELSPGRPDSHTEETDASPQVSTTEPDSQKHYENVELGKKKKKGESQEHYEGLVTKPASVHGYVKVENPKGKHTELYANKDELNPQVIYENADDKFITERTVHENTYFTLTKGRFQRKEVDVMRKTAPVRYQRYLSNQLDCLKKIGQHPNIVELIDMDIPDDKGLTMPFYTGYDLQYYLNWKASGDPEWNSSPQKLPFLKSMVVDILKGLGFLEGQKHDILHFQLSAKHVLVCNETAKCRLTGFGCKEHVQQREKAEENQKKYGNLAWKAPEIIENSKNHSKKSDVWAFGVLLYEIYTFGQQPYSGLTDDAIKMFVKAKRILEQPEECPPEMYGVMTSCWSYTPADRPSFKEILAKVSGIQKPTLAKKPDLIPKQSPHYQNVQ